MIISITVLKMATTLRQVALKKNFLHKKLSLVLRSAWCSSTPSKKNLWETRYRSDGRRERTHEKNPYDDSTSFDYFVRLTLFLQRDIDLTLSGIKKWFSNIRDDSEVYKQRYIAERVSILGADLAAAHFVVYRGGAVKFYTSPKWISQEKNKPYDLNLPRKFVPGVMVEAIDASDTNLIFEALAHLEILQRLKWLSFRNNANIDDWFLDRLAFCKDSLEYLDISGCPNVTERGVIALHRFRSLKVLKLGNLTGVKYAQLLRILLEEVLPDCTIEGIENGIDSLTSTDKSAQEKLQLG